MSDRLEVSPDGLRTTAKYFGDAADDLQSVGQRSGVQSGSALPPPAAAVMTELVDDWHDELRRLYEETYGVGEAVHDSADGFTFTDLDSRDRLVRLSLEHRFDRPA